MKHGLIGSAMPLLFGYFIVLSTSLVSQTSIPFQDCKNAFPICELKTYHFGQMQGGGTVSESPTKSACFDQNFKETNSFWLKWKADNAGTLTFVINPNQDEDDFDFILFKRSKNDCNALEEVRCMAAGESIGDEDAQLNERCKGRTGLSFSSVDEFESQGCKFSSDNFLKMLHVEKGEEYVLLVNNYVSQQGYSITFEGNTAFQKYNDCEILSINEPLMIVNLYPNPAINSVNIEFLAQKDENMEVDIMDITGKNYHHFDILPEIGKNKNTFLLTEMAQGSYLLRIRQGKFTTVRQFIKQ